MSPDLTIQARVLALAQEYLEAHKTASAREIAAYIKEQTKPYWHVSPLRLAGWLRLDGRFQSISRPKGRCVYRLIES